ncbi:MAG: hypothetical protein JW895_12830 [Thermoleophilaceae bacterium]|nr:hypothetical protein [Thermoleophilaceae bacterium]
MLSTNDGTTLAGANCDATYFGEELGGFTADCLPPHSAGENPAVTADRRRNEAIDYFLAHQRRALEVAGYRLLLAIVLAPLGLAIVTAAMTYGLVRLRHPAEVMTLVLAALAISRIAGLGRASATMARA